MMARRMPSPQPPDDGGLEKLTQFGDLLYPKDAIEPILAPAVRAALFEWLTEIRLGDELSAVGLKPRRTTLLYGAPGCGKTTLAHHFAARLGLPLLSVKSEALVDSHLGGTGKNLGQLFDLLQATAGQVVVFFDEVDAIGGRRMDDQGASVERASALTVILRRIEAFDGIALAATNRQDFLDDALWRRFDLQIPVDLPGADERFAILCRYLEPFRLDEDDIDTLVSLTSGASPALLRGLMEGVKRALILGPRVNRPIDTPKAVLASVIASVSPPPEFGSTPLLWTKAGFTQVDLPSWPPMPTSENAGRPE